MKNTISESIKNHKLLITGVCILLLGFIIGLSKYLRCANNVCCKLKAGDPKIVEIANNYATAHGQDLNLYKAPEITEEKSYWFIDYVSQKGLGFSNGLSIQLDRNTCQAKFIPQK